MIKLIGNLLGKTTRLKPEKKPEPKAEKSFSKSDTKRFVKPELHETHIIDPLTGYETVETLENCTIDLDYYESWGLEMVHVNFKVNHLVSNHVVEQKDPITRRITKKKLKERHSNYYDGNQLFG